MERNYMRFVGELRELLIASMGLENEQVYYEEKGGKYNCTGDRLFVECGYAGEEKKTVQVCGLYTRDLFESYCSCENMDKIVHMCVEEIRRAQSTAIIFRGDDLEDYNKIKDKLFIRLLNATDHEEELKEILHRVVGDIAIVVYIFAGEKNGYIVSTRVKNEMIKKWETDRDAIYETAVLNTYFLNPPRIYFWEKLVFDEDYSGENFMNLMMDYNIEKGIRGNCLSTTRRTNGAAAIFLPGVAKRLAELMEADLYLVFTSIHEVMVHSAQSVYPEDLKAVLKDTMRTATPPEERLSSYIYYYDRVTEKITMLSDI
nr:DUF5688 family protein [uncultured Blautia sp.]